MNRSSEELIDEITFLKGKLATAEACIGMLLSVVNVTDHDGNKTENYSKNAQEAEHYRLIQSFTSADPRVCYLANAQTCTFDDSDESAIEAFINMIKK